MTLNDDLDRRPIPPDLYSVLISPRVVTLWPGEQLVHIGGPIWLSSRDHLPIASGRYTFRDIKAIGDLSERLRTADTQLRRHLGAAHFAGERGVVTTGTLVAAIKAYAGRLPGLPAEIHCIPGLGEDLRFTEPVRWAIRIERRHSFE